MRDPAAEGGALVAGAGGLLLTSRLPLGNRPSRMVAENLPWIMMEAGRIAAPVLVHKKLRSQRIYELNQVLTAISAEEDQNRPWTQMAFVGGHLAQDTGNTPFANFGRSLGPLAQFGRFAGHQTLSLAQQIDQGYNAFALEFYQDGAGAIFSSHSTVWSYGLLQDGLTQIRLGLERNPDAIVVLKMSAQTEFFGHAALEAVLASGIGVFCYGLAIVQGTGFFEVPDISLSKQELRKQGIRAIFLNGMLENSWNAQTVSDLAPVAQHDMKATNDAMFGSKIRVMNLFQSWGYQPWSEHVNLFMPQLLKAYNDATEVPGAGINVIFANDLETSGLLAFKRLYNAPRSITP